MAKSKLGKGLMDMDGLAAIFGENVSDVLEDIQKGSQNYNKQNTLYVF